MTNLQISGETIESIRENKFQIEKYYNDIYSYHDFNFEVLEQ